MPRDLSAGSHPVQFTESPNSTASPSEQSYQGQLVLHTSPGPRSEFPDGEIHPYTRPLTISDLESCVALENAAFTNAEERCSREKFIYRLSKCGELSLGIFCTAAPDSKIPAETLKTGRPVESSREDGAIGVLLAHIIATKSNHNVVADEAMDYPRDWDSVNPARASTGHQEDGRTICVHSLGVLPAYQRRGLGRILMTAYMQQMNSAGIADKMAIICHDHLVPYYENLGYKNHGSSKAQFGGGGWVDMIFELKSQEPRVTYG